MAKETLFRCNKNSTLSSEILSIIKLFADDTNVYGAIADSRNDIQGLQNDLDHLANWATLRQHRFNPDESMCITHNHNKLMSPSYTMGSESKPVKAVKDLGDLISSDLSWSAQIDAVVNKANKILGIIYRPLGPTNQEAISTLYKTLVHLLLEYVALVWCPYLVKDILELEKVQKIASHLVLG